MFSRLTIIAALLAMMGPFTIDAYLPAFPSMEADFNVSRSLLAQSLSVYLAAFAISTLFWGPLADRYGRKLVIIASVSFFVAASAACAAAESYQVFLSMRALQGLAASGGLIAARAMIRDSHSAEGAHRAMSQMTLLFAIAPAIAPVLGDWLQSQFSWRAIFWFLAAFGALLMLFVMFIDETLSKTNRQSFHPVAVSRVYSRVLVDSRFLSLVFSLSFIYAGMFLYIAAAPTIIYDFLGLGGDDFVFQFAPMVAGLMLGAYVSSELAHRWMVTKVIALGFGCMFFAVLLNVLQVTYLQASIVTVITPLVIYVFGLALVMPAITVSALDCFPKNRGSAASMQGFFQMLITSGIVSVAVPLWHAELLNFVLGQACFLLISYFFWIYSKKVN